MDDAEKIQYREHLRQQLLESLRRLIFDKEDEFIGNHYQNESDTGKGKFMFYFGLTLSLMSYVTSLGRRHYTMIQSDDIKDEKECTEMANFFLTDILPRIKSFSKVDMEQLFLVSCLLEFAVAEMKRPFDSEILRLSVPPERAVYLDQIGFANL